MDQARTMRGVVAAYGGRLISRGATWGMCIMIGAAAPVVGQVFQDAKPERHAERRVVMQDVVAKRSRASANFDARYYHLQIDIDFTTSRIAGTTRVAGIFTSDAAEMRLDLQSNLTVAAVRDSSASKLAYEHADDVLTISLGETVPAGAHLDIEIEYGGQPSATGFGAFSFSTRDGQPVAWTLSEPYGARAWWPGKDHPSDKVDSARVTVTVPVGLRVGSNGVLASVTESGGTVTYDWIVRYPIAPYLLSLAAGPYAVFEQTYVRPDSLVGMLGDLSLPVTHYKYTVQGAAELPAGWAEVLDAIAVFEWWFGPYPFPDEKYGHAEFGSGGGMEHQTMSSMGGSSVGLVTHELAHQWFGDAVTNRTWPHLWLNEGFASYAEILYWETMADRYAGTARSALRVDQLSARFAQGTLVVEDTLDVRNLFAGSRVYAKGSAVLHMLRRVIGDANFRATLQAYLADPNLAYGTAVTDDFRRVAEAISGRSLETFFRQWVTEGTGYPIYEVMASQEQAAGGGYNVDVTVRQIQTSPESNVNIFVMPITLSIETEVGEQRFVVENTAREQTFTLHVDTRAIAVRFDPDGDLLSNEDVLVDFGDGLIPTTFAVDISPNPTDGPMRISVDVPTAADVRVDIFDTLGRHVRTAWDGTTVAGTFRLDTDLNELASGTYFVAARSEGAIEVRAVTVLR